MINPNDIQTKEFQRAVRGYNAEEVDQFLDEITIDLSNLIKENEDLKSLVASQEERIEKYKTQEGAILNTLESAKALMTDIAASAEKRADILIRNAELDADLKLRQAREDVERLRAEEIRLKQEVSGTKLKLKAMLESQLEKIDAFDDSIFSISDPKSDADEGSLDASSEDFLDNFGTSFDANSESTSFSDASMDKTITNFRGQIQ